MKILVKYPSRERAVLFESTLNKCIDNQTTSVLYLISLDITDPQLYKYEEICDKYENLLYTTNYSASKIEAVNRDVNQFMHVKWDILVLLSDDMICQKGGWDQIIIDKMTELYPDTDGVLWFSDGHTKLNTMCIIGRKYYERFRYIYNPEYTSLWSDNEFQEVAQMLGKTNIEPFECIFEHQHFSTSPNIKADTLMKKNEKFYNIDQKVYKNRRLNNFDLEKEDNIWKTK